MVFPEELETEAFEGGRGAEFPWTPFVLSLWDASESWDLISPTSRWSGHSSFSWLIYQQLPLLEKETQAAEMAGKRREGNRK